VTGTASVGDVAWPRERRDVCFSKVLQTRLHPICQVRDTSRETYILYMRGEDEAVEDVFKDIFRGRNNKSCAEKSSGIMFEK